MCGRELQSIKAEQEELWVLAALPGCGPCHDVEQGEDPSFNRAGCSPASSAVAEERWLPLRHVFLEMPLPSLEGCEQTGVSSCLFG